MSLEKGVKVVKVDSIAPLIKAKGARVKRLITRKREGSEIMSLGVYFLDPGCEESWKGGDEVYYILKGKARIYWDDKSVEIGEGDAVYLPAKFKYRQVNVGTEPFVYVYSASPPIE